MRDDFGEKIAGHLANKQNLILLVLNFFYSFQCIKFSYNAIFSKLYFNPQSESLYLLIIVPFTLFQSPLTFRAKTTHGKDREGKGEKKRYFPVFSVPFPINKYYIN